MKRLSNITLAVAVLVVAAGSASAETMKAEIPFAFHVGKQLMEPGAYHVRLMDGPSGNRVFALSSDAGKQTMLTLPTQSTPPQQWKSDLSPKLRFRCTDGYCELAQLWTGDDAFEFHMSGSRNSDVQIAEILLRPERAD